jgi:hypothetical protein
MPKYLIEASYTSEGAKGLLKDGGSKRDDRRHLDRDQCQRRRADEDDRPAHAGRNRSRHEEGREIHGPRSLTAAHVVAPRVVLTALGSGAGDATRGQAAMAVIHQLG